MCTQHQSFPLRYHIPVSLSFHFELIIIVPVANRLITLHQSTMNNYLNNNPDTTQVNLFDAFGSENEERSILASLNSHVESGSADSPILTPLHGVSGTLGNVLPAQHDPPLLQAIHPYEHPTALDISAHALSQDLQYPATISSPVKDLVCGTNHRSTSSYYDSAIVKDGVEHTQYRATPNVMSVMVHRTTVDSLLDISFDTTGNLLKPKFSGTISPVNFLRWTFTAEILPPHFSIRGGTNHVADVGKMESIVPSRHGESLKMHGYCAFMKGQCAAFTKHDCPNKYIAGFEEEQLMHLSNPMCSEIEATISILDKCCHIVGVP